MKIQTCDLQFAGKLEDRYAVTSPLNEVMPLFILFSGSATPHDLSQSLVSFGPFFFIVRS